MLPHKAPFSVACASKYDQHQQCCWKRNFVCLKICLTNYFRQLKENNGFVAPALAEGHKFKGLEGFPERLVPGAILCRDRIPRRRWEAVAERGHRGSPASHLGKNTLPAALEPSIPTNCAERISAATALPVSPLSSRVSKRYSCFLLQMKQHFA